MAWWLITVMRMLVTKYGELCCRRCDRRLEVGRRRGATSRKSTHDTTVRDATKNSGFKVTADGARQENEKH